MASEQRYQVNVILPAETRQRMKEAVAAKQALNLSDLARQAIEKHLDRLEQRRGA